ncbi:MAG: c-type cytochrome [Rhodobacteraceae bacterium]|nr:c-type cytochrome [Paracoccaceae bacterium]
MSKWRDLMICAALAAGVSGPVWSGPYFLGRPAEPDEIAAWNHEVQPDGTGLPLGQGAVEDGDVLFGERCAACHGDFAEGVGNWPTLSGGIGTLGDEDPVKTVGSYWPYLSTAWDFIHRSKPYGNAQTLEVDEVYSLVAFLLYSSDLVEDDFVLSHENFLDVKMPNANGFVVDDRAATEYPRFSGPPCMRDCRAPVKITKRATDLDLTPEMMVATKELDLLAQGEKVFAKCKACHQVGEGARDRVGPALNGIVGADAARADFFYSDGMRAAAKAGLVWDHTELAAYLANPKAYLPGTRMNFSGLGSQADIEAVIAFLASQKG